MDQAQTNLRWAGVLLDGLVRSGVKHLVVSPGARNTPLLIAGHQHHSLKLHVVVDERSAAFFALGLSLSTCRPVALNATSGTAVANWFPAVMEASQSGVPLILLSADRPWELQQCGANQTVDQYKLFGDYCRAFFALPAAESGQHLALYLARVARQAVAKATGTDAGPVQINLPFREPLVGSMPASTEERGVESRMPVQPRQQAHSDLLELVRSALSQGPGVIIAGQDCGNMSDRKMIGYLADRLAVPILADPLSGMRWDESKHGNVLAHYDLFLHWDSFVQIHPGWILRFGGMPVSTRLQDFLQSLVTARQFVVTNTSRWLDPQGRVEEVIQGDIGDFCRRLLEGVHEAHSRGWLETFQQADRSIEECFYQTPDRVPLEGQVIRNVLSTLPQGSLLFCGNSLAVRFMDAYGGLRDGLIRIHGNRGVSGIDGNISTVMGLAAGVEGSSKVVGIMGDLAFVHDLNSLATVESDDAVIIVFNNDGGGIFEYLPQQKLEGFKRLWKTPLGLDLQHLGKLFNIHFERVVNLQAFSDSLEQALQRPGRTVIEVMINGTWSRERHRANLRIIPMEGGD